MHHSVINFRNFPSAFSLPSKLLASSLLLGLCGALGTTVRAEPSTRPLMAQARPAAPTNQVAQRIMGQWQVRGARANETVKFIFGPQDRLFIVFPARSGARSPAVQMKYRINPAATPMHLDMITDKNETAPTIFEFTSDGQLRVQLQGTNPGQPRPTTFSGNATVLERVSDNTGLPSNAEVVSPQRTPNSAPQRR